MIDVIEIDAASYNGVENIREIIEHAKFTPTQGKYKIYIIDEVHMLSKWAFNALLKTLEEPPKHVIFLLATTEINKVPDTILSRVIRFDLERINDADMGWLLEKICKNEGIAAEKWALQLIIHRSRWSLRDSLTILEKCILNNALTQSYVESALHLVNTDFLAKTLEACISGDGILIQEILETMQKTGLNVRTFAGQMTEYIVSTIETALAKKQFPLYKNIFDRFTRIYVESRQVSVPMDVLTMSLCECITKNSDAITYNKQDAEGNILWEKVNTISETITHSPFVPEVAGILASDIDTAEEIPERIAEEPSTATVTKEPEENTTSSKAATKQILTDSTTFSSEIFIQKITTWWVKSNLIPLLRTADIILQDNILTIRTTGFAETKCRENANWGIIEKIWNEFGATTILITLLDENKEEVENISPIDVATEIFW